MPLQQWEFHDLLFHHRSRTGRHSDAAGGTYRFLGTLPPLPALKLPISDRRIALAPGLYRHDPLGHALEHLSELGAAQQAVIADGSGAAGLSHPPDVLITLAARFQRVSWKYQSLAYSLILKNVGALLQQMYLVATAMNLAPCALGGGNSDRFSEATGLDLYAENSVGEFLLSSRSRIDAVHPSS